MKIKVEVDVLEVCDDGKCKCLFSDDFERDRETERDESCCHLFHKIIKDYNPCPECVKAREEAGK